jgi:putative tryptophan/tyrosine transport system substrate-binding protein
MIKTFKKRDKAGMCCFIALLLLFSTSGSGHAMDKVFTIGVVNCVPILSRAVEGFKAGMTEQGYIEGKNVKYIFNGLIQNDQKTIEAEIRKLLSPDVDLLLSVGYEASLEVKKAVEGSDLPILVCFFRGPVESGLIKSFAHPGGNITGVAGMDRTAKALEWLKAINPGIKKVFLPYNPDDRVSAFSNSEIEEATSQLGIEVVFKKVHSVEETVTAIINLPKTVQAVFLVPSPTLNPGSRELCQAAISRGLTTGSSIALDEAVLATFTDDICAVGKETARLAHQIRLGAKPADLPFETSDIFLTVNLKTAEKIRLNIPDYILAQAKTIIR